MDIIPCRFSVSSGFIENATISAFGKSPLRQGRVVPKIYTIDVMQKSNLCLGQAIYPYFKQIALGKRPRSG
jgi:hypothetical protein